MQDQSSLSAQGEGTEAQPERAQAGRKVAILDDSKLSSHNLCVKLQFIGEEPRVFSPDQRQDLVDALKRGDFFALIIGTIITTPPANELQYLLDHQIDLPIIVTSNQVTPITVSDEFRQHVVAFHSRPVHYETLVEVLARARHLAGIEQQDFNSVIMSETGAPLFRGLVGNSRAMQALRQAIEQLTGESVTVLINGEEGTGTEIVARNLHFASGRQESAFVAVNCAALTPASALEELFGCEAGYHPGGKRRQGQIELAAGGTLYLDKIEELPLDVQAHLVNFMESGSFERLGGQDAVRADVRIIAGSYVRLEDSISRKAFRSDLFYRLNVFPISMPPLRERSEDIPELIAELVSRLQHRQRQPVSFDFRAILSLQAHAWPGNVRELANLVERLSIIKGNGTVMLEDLPPEYRHAIDESVTPVEEMDADDTRGERYTPGQSVQQDSAGSQNHTADIPFAGPLDDARLEQVLQGFARSMVEVALDDSLFIESLAAERLNLSEQEFSERRMILQI